jgi:hypothetical protein
MRRWTRILLLVALVLIGFLTIRFAVHGFYHARDLRAGTEESIQPWMNIPHIAHAYHVDPWVIHEALGLPPDQPDRRPLREIAREQGRSTDELINDVMAAIRRVRPAPPLRPGTPAIPPVPPERQP